MAERSLTTLLQDHASHQPDGIASTFVDYGVKPSKAPESVARAHIKRRARLVAEELRVCSVHDEVFRSMNREASSAIPEIYRLCVAGALS